MIRTLLIAVSLLFTSASALAFVGYNHPQIEGIPVDATTWDYPGGEASEYNRAAANLYCKYTGNQFASYYRLGPQPNPNYNAGTMRFNKDGTYNFCDFCTWFFTYIRCEQ